MTFDAPPTLVNGEDRTPMDLLLEMALAQYLKITKEEVRVMDPEIKSQLEKDMVLWFIAEEGRLMAERAEQPAGVPAWGSFDEID